MSHFFVHLPSNSSESYYPENTRAHFTTHLLNKVELQGDWEVGLSEILFSKTWYNLKDGEYLDIHCTQCKTSKYPDEYRDYSYTVSISGGNYASVHELVHELNTQMQDYAEFVDPPMTKAESENSNPLLQAMISKGMIWPKFRYNTKSNKVSIGIRQGLSVTLSNGLRHILGFRRKDMPIKAPESGEYDIIEANRTADINSGLETFYVYCNLLEYIPVGHTEAPLLRIVDSGIEQQGTLVRRHYESPIYLPVQKKNFDSIEIDLRTDLGKPVPFERGQVVLTLHFRKSNNSYFT